MIVSVVLALIGSREVLQRKPTPTKIGPELMRVRERDSSIQPSTHDGFIIVAVLWILVALAALASIYSIYIRNSALAVSVMDDELQADALVSAGLSSLHIGSRFQRRLNVGRAVNSVSGWGESILWCVILRKQPGLISMQPQSLCLPVSLGQSVRREKTRIATPIESSVGVNLQSEATSMMKVHFTVLLD